MPIYTDQLNRPIHIPQYPKRIISLVPSQTELLIDLGLQAQLLGITKFCIHPAAATKQILKIGGTKALDIKLIKELNPDLIIGNKEENERAQIEELMSHFPVWMSDIADLDGAINMITGIGELVNKATEAAAMTATIKQNFEQLNAAAPTRKVAYLIWRKPYMVAGKGTFIDDMLRRCGFVNVFAEDRYPEVSIEQLISAQPDALLLSSEPYPFKEKHINEFRATLPHATIKLVDGEMFSWYGSRLLQAPAYFNKLIASF